MWNDKSKYKIKLRQVTVQVMMDFWRNYIAVSVSFNSSTYQRKAGHSIDPPPEPKVSHNACKRTHLMQLCHLVERNCTMIHVIHFFLGIDSKPILFVLCMYCHPGYSSSKSSGSLSTISRGFFEWFTIPRGLGPLRCPKEDHWW